MYTIDLNEPFFGREKGSMILSENERLIFDDLYKKYAKKILKFISCKGIETMDAEDITSRVFVKALDNFRNYEDRGYSFGTWLFKVASNEVSQFYRDLNKTQMVPLSMEDFNVLEEESLSSERNEVLQSILNNLSKKEKTIIQLRYFENLSFREIAEILSISESNAKVRCFRTIEKMRKLFY
jgi:RNA polymerase sigma-70 factor (ECF subfamily)